MADYPDRLQKGRHRDLAGRNLEIWVRRAVLVLFGAVAVAGLLNAFGQRSETSRAEAPAARMEVRGPERVRGGLLYQQHITVRALSDIDHPRLVLARGW